MRDNAATRNAIIAAYKAGTAKVYNRGPWSNQEGIYAAPNLGVGSWPHFGPTGTLSFQHTETYNNTQTQTFIYNDGTPTATDTDQTENSILAEATIPRARITKMDYLSQPIPEIPEGEEGWARAYHYHASATPYGDGLYDVAGFWKILCPARLITSFDSTAGGGIFDTYSDTTTLDTYFIEYNTKGAKLRGLNTEMLITLNQTFHGPSFAFLPNVSVIVDLPGGDDDVFEVTPIPFIPPETDPDGNPGNAVEMYYNKTGLRALADGEFTDEMDLLGGSTGRSATSTDETSPIASTSWSHTWGRTGSITINWTP